VAPNVDKMCRKFSKKKHVKLYIKTYLLIFCIFIFLPKYLCIITYAYEKSLTHGNYHNLNYPMFFT